MERSGEAPNQLETAAFAAIQPDPAVDREVRTALSATGAGAKPDRTAGPTGLSSYQRLAVVLLIGCGLYFRWAAVLEQPLWVDEAESAINALTILEHGMPVSHYLGMPIFENTLTETWPESREYEFRDNSYSSKGLAVYHGWLPLYSIAAAQALAGIKPDGFEVGQVPTVQHDEASVAMRTIAPRLPALVFSLGFMILAYRVASEMAGNAAGMAALTWAAISNPSVLFGHQARYYSLTLFLCALFLFVFLRVYRRGLTRDFVFLGLVAGLLFHSHQLSALVACVTSLAGLPHIVKRNHWLRNSLLAAGTALLIVLPWALFSGFFSALSRVPMIITLFHEPLDWFRYVLKYAVPAAIGAGGFALVLALAYRRSGGGRRPVSRHELLREHAILLLVWSVLCLLAFHTILPAGSYFTERLTLMLLTPYVILVSIAVGLICERFAARWAPWAAVAMVLLILIAIGETPALKAKPLPEARAMGPALAALRALPMESGDRFYSLPNEHLVFTYYTGLPVQSIAPVRKTFLDNYDGNIVMLERRFHDAFASEGQIQRAAAAHGQEISLDEASRLRSDLWRRQVSAELAVRGYDVDPGPAVPVFLDEVAVSVRDFSRRTTRGQMRYNAQNPIFRGIQCADAAEQWLAFFYRFVGPEGRIGANANYHDRLQRAKLTLVADAALAIYVSPPSSPPRAPRL